jgi:dephospho-CoA kinase
MIVGLTGGIGSGKSEVSRRFQKLGVLVVDADEVARQVVEPGRPVLDAIAKHFGENILQPNKTLNRSELRKIIFSNPNEKAWLESLLHPIIRSEIITQLARAKSAYAILSSPLLLETNQHQLVQRVLVVDANEELQITRASARDNNSTEQIKNIMAAQLSRAARCAKADDVILNDGDVGELDLKVAALHNQYIEQSRQIK